MKTIWDKAAREDLNNRLGQLRADSVPQWGKFNCGQMLSHCADGLRMALGEIEVKPKGGPLRLAPLRYLIIYVMPFPKGAPTAPELLARPSKGIEGEIADIKNLLERIAQNEANTEWPEHPAFGKMTARDWGALGYKHLDHHLRQFGV